MISYSLVQSVKVICGKGKVNQIGELLKVSGYKKAFLVFDEGIKNTGIIDRVIECIVSKGIEYITFGEVIPDPPANIINKGAKLCKELNCDCVIGIGGGSCIDTAKGINILRVNGDDILEYTTNEYKKCDGLITIPTTSGTGSELSNGAIISDLENNKKLPIATQNCMSEYTILDSELTVNLPRGLTLMTGLDAFSHAVEAYTSTASNPSTDLICEKVMQTVVEYLPKVLADGKDIEAREKMQVASSLGGWMLYNACAHIGHSLAHVIGGTYHLPHGAVCAYGFPAMIEFISDAVPNKVKEIGKILGVKFEGNESNLEIGNKTANAYIKFRDSLELKSIKEYCLNLSNLDELVTSVVNEPFAILSPKKVTAKDAETMIRKTLQI